MGVAAGQGGGAEAVPVSQGVGSEPSSPRPARLHTEPCPVETACDSRGLCMAIC